MSGELVHAGKNIYFVQYGINQNNLTPATGGCAIDHESIDWDDYDLTGGIGVVVGLVYNDDSFFGVNFFKADNTTPLGLHNTCPSSYSVGDSINFG